MSITSHSRNKYAFFGYSTIKQGEFTLTMRSVIVNMSTLFKSKLG